MQEIRVSNEKCKIQRIFDQIKLNQFLRLNLVCLKIFDLNYNLNLFI